MCMMKTNGVVANEQVVVATKGMDIDAFVDAFFSDLGDKAPKKTVVQVTPSKRDANVADTAEVSKAQETPTAPKKKFRLPNGQYIEGYSATWSGNGELLEVDGVRIAMTAEERKKAKRDNGSRKGGGARKDEGREFLIDFAHEALSTPLAKAKLAYTADFKHSKEGHVYRCDEADYGIRVSKSKEAKFDVSEEGFKPEVSYITRGKAKHSGGTIARLIVHAVEHTSADIDIVIAEAKASGVIVHFNGAEYTIKIAKKRERCGFEAERSDAY